MAVRKEIFRWQLVANREVSGSPEVSRVPHRLHATIHLRHYYDIEKGQVHTMSAEFLRTRAAILLAAGAFAGSHALAATTETAFAQDPNPTPPEYPLPPEPTPPTPQQPPKVKGKISVSTVRNAVINEFNVNTTAYYQFDHVQTTDMTTRSARIVNKCVGTGAFLSTQIKVAYDNPKAFGGVICDGEKVSGRRSQLNYPNSNNYTKNLHTLGNRFANKVGVSPDWHGDATHITTNEKNPRSKTATLTFARDPNDVNVTGSTKQLQSLKIKETKTAHGKKKIKVTPTWVG